MMGLREQYTIQMRECGDKEQGVGADGSLHLNPFAFECAHAAPQRAHMLQPAEV